MNFNLVWAVVVRHLYNMRHSLDRISDSFYWPAMDLFIWGFTSTYIVNNSQGVPNLLTLLLGGMIFWRIVWQSQYQISINLLEEMWNQNVVNLFSSPLRLREWILGVFILGIIQMFVSTGFVILLAFLLYKMNIFTFGFYLVPFFISLVITGWAIGLIVSGFIVRYGVRIQTFAWSGSFLIAPFSGVYYSVSTLPFWAQKISYILPTSYIFEGMRTVVSQGYLPMDMLLKSFGLNLVLFSLGLWFFVFMFDKSKKRGLARLE